MKEYINQKVMPNYALNFKKRLPHKDIMYYAKIHYERGAKGEGNLHAHIIVSLKDVSTKIKLSSNTNHRGTNKGAVTGGFDRTIFVENVGRGFDAKFNYERVFNESFKDLNTLKNGTSQQKEIAKRRENLKPNDIERRVQEKVRENQLRRKHNHLQPQSQEREKPTFGVAPNEIKKKLQQTAEVKQEKQPTTKPIKRER